MISIMNMHDTYTYLVSLEYINGPGLQVVSHDKLFLMTDSTINIIMDKTTGSITSSYYILYGGMA